MPIRSDIKPERRLAKGFNPSVTDVIEVDSNEVRDGSQVLLGNTAVVVCQDITTVGRELELGRVFGRTLERHVDVNGFTVFCRPKEQYIGAYLKNLGHYATASLSSGLSANS